MDTRLFRQRKHLSSAIGTQVPRFPDPLSHSVFALASRAASLALASSVVSIGAGLTCSSPAFATTYIVDTTGDPGPAGTLSLRQAIQNASYYTGDTIQFAPALNGSTITLQAGQLVVPSSMTIQGPGSGKLTISANNASRIFQIYTLGATPLAVTISGLTLTGGNTGGNGGAIYAENIDLNLQNVVLSGNSAHFGGAVYGKNGNAGATTTFTNAMIQGNSASYGGGLFMSGGTSTTITSSIISGNNATTCCGGGLIQNSGSATLSHSTIGANNVSVASPSGNGGGLALDNIGTPVQISYSAITGNVTPNGRGGGLWISNSDANIVASNITGNIGYDGGGVYSHDNRPTAQAIISLRGTTLSGNTAQFFGGGLDVNRANTLTVGYSLISDNRATNGVNSLGGGIALRSTLASAHIYDSTVYGNHAYGKGGGIGITAAATGNVTTLTSLTIVGNSTNAAGSVGAGVFGAGMPQLDSCIAANNYSGANLQDLNGSFTANFSAIKTRGTATITGSNNLADGTDPNLGPLTVNGGPTLSMLPNIGSPVLATGDPGVTQTSDQRGLPRKTGGFVDIGAVERHGVEDVIFRNGFEAP